MIALGIYNYNDCNLGIYNTIKGQAFTNKEMCTHMYLNGVLCIKNFTKIILPKYIAVGGMDISISGRR